jgi:hypothetical protein
MRGLALMIGPVDAPRLQARRFCGIKSTSPTRYSVPATLRLRYTSQYYSYLVLSPAISSFSNSLLGVLEFHMLQDLTIPGRVP